jgi:sphinganine-1-phosphate aldolase
LAIKSHRDYYCKKYGIKHPELIAATSAHAAVDKACDMMNIRLIKIPIDAVTCKANVSAIANAISPNTILIYSSAPSYPQGVIDPISELAKIAHHHDVGLHVDCCLGGFVLPFAKKLGYNIPDFDFTIQGVTSMSLDTHKYGYALKGTSVVLYRSRELRQAQYFCYADWSGGLYTTPTIAGSRSGGMIAQCWASLVALGEEGYLQHTKDIMDCTKRLADGIRKIDGLQVIGNAEVMIVCFVGSPDVNVYSVVDVMAKKGWSLSSHQLPACAHICCTLAHVGNEAKLLQDLQICVDEVRSDPNKKSGKAAIYGMTSTLPAGPVNDMLKIYNDVVLKV